MLWPTYELRAKLTALLEHLHAASAPGMALSRNQADRAAKVMRSLKDLIGRVDSVLRHVRDTGMMHDIAMSGSQRRDTRLASSSRDNAGKASL